MTKTQSPQALSTTKRIVCHCYNEGTCPHTLDATGTTRVRHIFMQCFKHLRRNNNHTDQECLNKKKSVE